MSAGVWWERSRSVVANTGAGRRVAAAGALEAVVRMVSMAVTALLMWQALFAVSDRHLHGALFLMAMLPIIFLTATASKAIDHITFFDYALALVSIGVGLYYALNNSFYYDLVEGLTPISSIEKGVGILLVLLCVETCRRTIGWGLMSVLLVLLAYTVFGHFLPGGLHHEPIDLEYFIEMQTVTNNGVFGVPLQVAATYAFLFMLFGSFYQRAGGGQLFFDLAGAITGRASGGPAKVCVVSSGLYGSISGSPTADVVTTGPVTIPLMVRVGMPAERAGAIEAAASTGGALLPPVMGSAAFLMVEFTGIPYDEIVKAAAIAGLLYYAGVFLLVHHEARRTGEGRIDETLIVGLGTALRRGWFHIVPIAGLLYFLVQGYSPTYVAAGSTVFVIVISWFNPDRKGRIGIRGVIEASSDTVERMAVLVGAVLAAGIIIGCIDLTGLAGKFTLMMYYISGGNAVLVLIASAIVLIMLGMGMPTQGVYVMGAALLAPTLMLRYHFPLLQTHMFLLYFASLSAITPPLAVACFAAATIADASPWKIAIGAVRFGFAGFILPFFFILNPGLLMVGNGFDVASACAVAIVLVLLLSAVLDGWVGTYRLSWWQWLGLACVAIAMMWPYPWIQFPLAAACAAVMIGLPFLGRAARQSQAIDAPPSIAPPIAGE